jgi:DNA-binding GntR family transcriptional regulator
MYRRLCLFQLQERALRAVPVALAGRSTEQHQAIVAAFEANNLTLARSALEANAATGKEIMIEEIERAGGCL